jgi:hypothetical protein
MVIVHWYIPIGTGRDNSQLIGGSLVIIETMMESWLPHFWYFYYYHPLSEMSDDHQKPHQYKENNNPASRVIENYLSTSN